MTWNPISQASTIYSTEFADSLNGYVLLGYVFNDYIIGSEVWSVIPTVSATWVVA